MDGYSLGSLLRKERKGLGKEGGWQVGGGKGVGRWWLGGEWWVDGGGDIWGGRNEGRRWVWLGDLGSGVAVKCGL
jgi:hypothetical protein